MKKRSKAKRKLTRPISTAAREEQEIQRGLRAGVRRQKAISQLAKRLTWTVQKADRALRDFATFIQERDGDTAADVAQQVDAGG